MGRYIARRLLMLPVVLLGVSLIVFFMVRLVPGDAAIAMIEEANIGSDQQVIEKIREELGLDKPVLEQYGDWLWNALQLDLGNAFFGGQSVWSNIGRSFPITLELALMSLIIGIVIAIPLGTLAAIKADTWVDYIARFITVMGISVPDFIFGMALLVLPAIWFGWLPTIVYIPFVDDPLGNIKQFALPALAIGTRLTSTLSRMTRSSMLEVLRQDYIRTAWAKGLRQRVVIFRHALKNAMIAPITIIGTQVAFLIGGTIVSELIFNLPGIGRSTLVSIETRDFKQLMGNTLVLATGIVLVNILVDLSYGWIDPRIRYS
jgi:peptide/nickel transport system permease protein